MQQRRNESPPFAATASPEICRSRRPTRGGVPGTPGMRHGAAGAGYSGPFRGVEPSEAPARGAAAPLGVRRGAVGSPPRRRREAAAAASVAQGALHEREPHPGAFLAMEENGEPFADFVWSFVDNHPQVTTAAALAEIPTTTPASDALSKALKKRGFKFVGSTICYSFMQACGLVNDHVTGCFCRSGGQDDPQLGR